MADSRLRRLLGGRTPAAFLARYWHRDALLVRAAATGFSGLHSRDELFRLATRDDVESRLVQRDGSRYTLDHGPFRLRDLLRLPPRRWTLLVQGVNGASDAADALLRRFAFVPYARLDDLMVSYATPGGGVGPHFDSYDVFLLQGAGRRRWRYGRQRDLSLQADAPLRILRRFAPAHDVVLAPGDMLYLPPHYAHDGVAVDACTTYSIGFRAPLFQELAESFLDHLRDTIELPGRYADAGLRPTRSPARIDTRMRSQVADTLQQLRWNRAGIDRFLGRFLSEPKPDIVFSRPRAPSAAAFARRIAEHGVALDRRTQLLYDDDWFYVNGEEVPQPPDGSDAIRRLANRRALPARECAALPPAAIATLLGWHRHGYLAPHS